MSESYPDKQLEEDRLAALRILSDAELIKGGAKVQDRVLSPTGQQRENMEARTSIDYDYESPELGWASYDDILEFCKGLYPGDEMAAQKMATRIENRVIFPLGYDQYESNRGGRSYWNGKRAVNVDILELQMGRHGVIRMGGLDNVGPKTIEVLDKFIQARRAAVEQATQPDAA